MDNKINSKNNASKQSNGAQKHSKSQRVVALSCVILIVAVYLTALVASFFSSDLGKTIAKIALGATVVLPLLAWLYIWMIGHIFHKHTIADFDLGGVPTDHTGILEYTEDSSKDK